jgi:hypothetical protein
MNSPAFFQTRMGARYYEHTMPKVADQLERLNANLEALVTELRLQRESRATKEAAPQPPEQR